MMGSWIWPSPSQNLWFWYDDISSSYHPSTAHVDSGWFWCPRMSEGIWKEERCDLWLQPQSIRWIFSCVKPWWTRATQVSEYSPDNLGQSMWKSCSFPSSRSFALSLLIPKRPESNWTSGPSWRGCSSTSRFWVWLVKKNTPCLTR